MAAPLTYLILIFVWSLVVVVHPLGPVWQIQTVLPVQSDMAAMDHRETPR